MLLTVGLERHVVVPLTLHHVEPLHARTRRVEGGEATGRLALDACAVLLLADAAEEPEAFVFDAVGVDDVTPLRVQELHPRHPQRAHDVRPTPIGGPFQRTVAVGAENARGAAVGRVASVGAAWVGLTDVTVPRLVALRNVPRARAVAHLVDREVARVAKDDLVVILPVALAADGAAGEVLEAGDGLGGCVLRRQPRPRRTLDAHGHAGLGQCRLFANWSGREK